MDKADFEALAKRLRSDRDEITYQVTQLRLQRPGIAAHCCKTQDYSPLDRLDAEMAAHERRLIGNAGALQFVTQALALFTQIEVSEATLVHAADLRAEAAQRYQAAQRVDLAMQDLLRALLSFDGPRGLGVSRLKIAWNFHCHQARLRDHSRAVQTQIQTMTQPLAVNEARSTFAELAGQPCGESPDAIETAAQAALQAAQADLNHLLAQMTIPQVSPPKIASKALETA